MKQTKQLTKQEKINLWEKKLETIKADIKYYQEKIDELLVEKELYETSIEQIERES